MYYTDIASHSHLTIGRERLEKSATELPCPSQSVGYRGTSPIRKRLLLGPYSRDMLRALR